MTKVRHIPSRRCVVCRKIHQKGNLNRFYRDADGQWQLDPSTKTPGRGAWLCKTCWLNSSSKELQRFFRNQATRVEELLRTKGHGIDDNVLNAGGMNA